MYVSNNNSQKNLPVAKEQKQHIKMIQREEATQACPALPKWQMILIRIKIFFMHLWLKLRK